MNILPRWRIKFEVNGTRYSADVNAENSIIAVHYLKMEYGESLILLDIKQIGRA